MRLATVGMPGPAPGSMEARMSIASIAVPSAGSMTGGVGTQAAAGQSTFGVALGKAHKAHSRHDEAAGADGAAAAPRRTLAADCRALVGDKFGALGADTPTDVAAKRAVRAYGQAAAMT
jgi:hypothetical protein